MSEKKPTINVTRGTRDRSKKEQTAPPSTGLAEVATGAVTGVARTVRNVWLAGLGALSMVEDASARAFNVLVEEGKSWERTRREGTEAAARRLQRLRDEGTQTVEALDRRVREEIDDALERVGVPSRDDIDGLRREVDQLTKKVDRLAGALQNPDAEKKE